MKKALEKRIRCLVAVAALAGIGWFLFSVRTILTPFFLGFLAAYILHPLVDFLELKGIPRGIAIAVIYLVFALMGGLFIYYALPVLFGDLNRVVQVIPEYTRHVREALRGVELGYQAVPLPDSVREIINQNVGKIESIMLGIVRGFAGGLVGLLSQVFNLVMAPVLSFYILLEYNRLGTHFLALIPVRFRAEAAQVSCEINTVIKRFIRGNLFVACIVGFMAAAGMALIGMDFPLLIGILVGMTNFIPYFGAIISTIIVVLLALLKSKWLAVYVLGVMLLIQQVEGNIIAPRILGSSVGLHPLLIILALLIGGKLWGAIGLLLAVPGAAVLKVILKHFYTRLI